MFYLEGLHLMSGAITQAGLCFRLAQPVSLYTLNDEMMMRVVQHYFDTAAGPGEPAREVVSVRDEVHPAAPPTFFIHAVPLE